MNFNKILIVLGEPNSIFSEVLFKYFNLKSFKKNKSIIIIVGNKKLILKQMRKLRYDFDINEINHIEKAKKKAINLIAQQQNLTMVPGGVTTRTQHPLQSQL